MITNFVFYYIITLLITFNLLNAWYHSPFGVKICKFLFKENDNTLSIEDILFKNDEKYNFVSELLSCPICFGTWISLLISLVLSITYGLGLLFIITCTLSIPSIVSKKVN